MKQLALEFVEVTEAAAIAAASWIGRRMKNEADAAATDAMRQMLNRMAIQGTVVIGEGELDEAPMLHIGEKVGSGQGPQLDIAVDPLEGTHLMVTGQGNAIAVIAAAPSGALLHAPDMYMEKIAVGKKAAGLIDIDAPLLDNMNVVAKANHKQLSEITVAVQERERHREIIRQIQEAGAKVQLFHDGDVMFALAAAIEESPIDMLAGIGGAPEGVVSAVGLRCLGGELQARLLPQDEQEWERCRSMGLENPRARLPMNQLVRSEECLFAATGITDGILLKGVKQINSRHELHSLLLVSDAQRSHYLTSVYAGSD